MGEGRNLAAASGALVRIFFRRQEITDIHFEFTEVALHFWDDLLFGFAGEVCDHSGFFVRATPADWTAVVGLIIDGNAAFVNPAVIMKFHVAVDLVTVLVFFQRLIFPVFPAYTRVTASASVDPFAFVVRFVAELTFGQFIQILP